MYLFEGVGLVVKFFVREDEVEELKTNGVMIRSISSVEGCTGVIKTRDSNVCFSLVPSMNCRCGSSFGHVVCIFVVTVWTRLKEQSTFTKVYDGLQL